MLLEAEICNCSEFHRGFSDEETSASEYQRGFRYLFPDTG